MTYLFYKAVMHTARESHSTLKSGLLIR